MKYAYSILLSVITLLNSIIFQLQAQPPVYIWAKTLPGNVESIQRTIIADANGNVYISGVFFGTVDFDPGPGVANITPSPYGCNVYIAKYDANGNYTWARNIPIAASYGGSSMVLDGNGNIYIAGFFTGSNLDFNPGAGINFLSSSGGNDGYLAKYDNNGNYLWAVSIGASGDDRINEVTVDANNNIFITGIFSLTVDFDPGAGVSQFTSSGGPDIFLAKFNSNGIFQWTKQIGGASTEDVRDIALDISGNIFLTGLFSGTTDFDPSAGIVNLTSAGGNDVFIAKYNNSGNYVWANRFGSTNSDGGSALKTDAAGNVFVTGIFMGTVDFDPGPAIVNQFSSAGATYFGKYDPNGNYIWIRMLPINFYNSDIVLTAMGNIFIAGYYGNGYGSPIDMDPGPGVAQLAVPTNLPPPTYNLLGYYDALGNYLWAGVFGRQCYCSVMGYKSSIFIDGSGYLYYAGIFNGPWGTGTVDFDPGAGVANLYAPSSVDNTFFAKYLVDNIPLPVELISFNGKRINKVNHLHWATSSEINNDYFEVERSTDGQEFESIARVPGHGNSSTKNEYSFDDVMPFENLEYYRLKQVDYDGNYRFSAVILLKNDSESKCKINSFAPDGIFHLQCSNFSGGTFSITDVNGKIIVKSDFYDVQDYIQIDLSDYSPGIYFIKIVDDDQCEFIKLMSAKI